MISHGGVPVFSCYHLKNADKRTKNMVMVMMLMLILVFVLVVVVSQLSAVITWNTQINALNW